MKSSNNYIFKGILSFVLFSIVYLLDNIGNVILRNDGQPGIPLDPFFSILSFLGLIFVPIGYFLIAIFSTAN